MLISLVAGVVSALCYGVATVIQAIAVREAARRPDAGAADGVDPGLLIRMLRQWRFTASLAVDLAGFGAQLVALHRLPLFTVQAMVAAELAVIAVLASAVMNAGMRAREWLAVGGVIAGVALLGLSAGAEGATAAGTPFKLALLIATGALAAVGFAVGRLRGQARTLLLGAVAGLGYGVVGVAARVLAGFGPLSLVRDPAAYAIVAAAVVAFMFYTSALDGGDVTVTTAAIILTETLPPAVIGVLFLGDTTRPGVAPAAAAGVGFVLAVSCALLLARFGEPEAGEPGTAGGPGTAGESGTAGNEDAGRVMLRWWSVDLRPRAAPSLTTGVSFWPLHRRSLSMLIRSISSSPVASPPAWARA